MVGAVFKIVERRSPSLAGSIPVRLRHIVVSHRSILLAGLRPDGRDADVGGQVTMTELRDVVLMLTDVEGSTRLWADEHDAMYDAMGRHHKIIHDAVRVHDGWRPVDQGEGDAVFAAFDDADMAVRAAVACQRALVNERWSTSRPLKVRIGVHRGVVSERDGNLFGDAVNRCARLRGLGWGGQTLLSQAVIDALSPQFRAAVTVTDLGEHRMKDLTRAEHVFQLDIGGLGTSFPALRSLNAHRHNLPIQTSSFIGRATETSNVLELLGGAHRLVTITGFGGMGKTRLALQVAADWLERPDPEALADAWFVDFSAVTDPELVPARVAENLNVEWGTDGPLDALLATIGDRPTLLVLDNLEQILDCAPFVTQLLEGSNNIRILVTSREPLRIRGERQWTLPPLPTPEPGLSAAQLSTYDAIRLFVDRAADVRPGFVLTDDNIVAVAAICQRLEGQPLAIELAAARSKLLKPDQLIVKLDRAVEFLVAGPRDVPDRQRTLRATIAWSIDMLHVTERRLIDAMAALPAPANVEMIDIVCDPQVDTFGLIESLVEKSLLTTVEGEDDPRFGMLVSIREYLSEPLGSEFIAQVKDRHANFLLRQLTAMTRQSREDEQLRFVARELDHLRSAISHCVESGLDETERSLVMGLGAAMLSLGHVAEYLDIVTHALASADDHYQRAMLHETKSMAFDRLWAEPQSEHEARLARAEADLSGDTTLMIRTRIQLCVSQVSRSEQTRLIDEVDSLLTKLPADQRERHEAHRDGVVAWVFRFTDSSRAEAAARRQLDTDAEMRIRLADILLDRGEFDEASYVMRPLANLDRLGADAHMRLNVGLLLAQVAIATDDLSAARAYAQDTFDALWNEGGLPTIPAYLLAHIELRAGDPVAGLGILDKALTRSYLDPEHSTATLLWRRGRLHRAIGNTERGRADLDMALGLYAKNPTLVPFPALLAILIEKAAQSAGNDPMYSASVLGCVATQRGDIALWAFDMDRERKRLESELLPLYQGNFESGRELDPYAVAFPDST